jgi:hypothetical protein
MNAAPSGYEDGKTLGAQYAGSDLTDRTATGSAALLFLLASPIHRLTGNSERHVNRLPELVPCRIGLRPIGHQRRHRTRLAYLFKRREREP